MATLRRRTAALGLVLAFVALAGCSDHQVPVLAADPGAAILLGFRGPADFRYACNASFPFDGAILLQPGTDEQANAPDATALRKYLGTPEATAENLPATGWHLLGRQGTSAEYATYVATGPDAPTVRTITVEEGWRVLAGGYCAPSLAFPPAVGIATWTLDPDGPRPGPDTSVITVLVQEHNCASGRGPEGRIVGPVVFRAEARIQILFGVRQLDATVTCQRTAPGRVKVDLSEAIGERVLVDPAVWPATVVDLKASGQP